MQYKYFTLFLMQRLQGAIDESQDFCKKGPVKLDHGFLQKPFYRDYLHQFNGRFDEWLTELSANTVAFTPFKAVNDKTLFQLLNGVDIKKPLFGFGKDNYDLFIECLNEAEEKVTAYPIEEKFIAIFYLATHKMVGKKFGV